MLDGCLVRRRWAANFTDPSGSELAIPDPRCHALHRSRGDFDAWRQLDFEEAQDPERLSFLVFDEVLEADFERIDLFASNQLRHPAFELSTSRASPSICSKSKRGARLTESQWWK